MSTSETPTELNVGSDLSPLAMGGLLAVHAGSALIGLAALLGFLAVPSLLTVPGILTVLAFRTVLAFNQTFISS